MNIGVFGIQLPVWKSPAAHSPNLTSEKKDHNDKARSTDLYNRDNQETILVAVDLKRQHAAENSDFGSFSTFS